MITLLTVCLCVISGTSLFAKRLLLHCKMFYKVPSVNIQYGYLCLHSCIYESLCCLLPKEVFVSADVERLCLCQTIILHQ